MIKLNRRVFIDRQRKGVVVGEEENRRTFSIFLSRALRSFSRACRCFRKERKEKENNVCVQAKFSSDRRLWNGYKLIVLGKIYILSQGNCFEVKYRFINGGFASCLG